ncbi:MAG TPA: hypothetical protein VG055_11975 [Planctomycetaceae bacterium]|nr:hypothetical protein [Planctomycetaceae bacterium]
MIWSWPRCRTFNEMVICYHQTTDGDRILAEGRFTDCHAIKHRSAAATSITPGMWLTTDWPQPKARNWIFRLDVPTEVLERDGHQPEGQSDLRRWLVSSAIVNRHARLDCYVDPAGKRFGNWPE